jgi:hypothetical protein
MLFLDARSVTCCFLTLPVTFQTGVVGNVHLLLSSCHTVPSRPLPFIRHSRFLTTSRTIRLFGAGVTVRKLKLSFT